MLRPREEVQYVDVPGNPNLVVKKKSKPIDGPITDNLKVKNQQMYDKLLALFKDNKIPHPEDRAKQFEYLLTERLETLDDITKEKEELFVKTVQNTSLDEMEKTVKKIQSFSKRNESIEKIENFLEPLLLDALQPFYRFITMVEAESGSQIYYRWLPEGSIDDKRSPLVKGTKTDAEFKLKNRHLGPDMFTFISKKEKEEYTLDSSSDGLNISDKGDTIDFLGPQIHPNVLANSDIPDYMWDILPDPAFQFLLKGNVFGSLVLAAQELDFPLKALIKSKDTSHYFAQFVAKKFISPKQNAYASGISGGQMQYRISSGYRTSGAADTQWFMGCKEWFKKAYMSDGVLKREKTRK